MPIANYCQVVTAVVHKCGLFEVGLNKTMIFVSFEVSNRFCYTIGWFWN